MIFNDIKQFFQKSSETKTVSQAQLNLAACSLLFEIIKADQKISPEEQESLRQIASELFAIDTQAADELIALAHKSSDDSVDLYQFTRCINHYYSHQEKYQLLIALWKIAFADNYLDQYEEASIRKISDLLYLDHSEFIHAKQQAKNQKTGD